MAEAIGGCYKFGVRGARFELARFAAVAALAACAGCLQMSGGQCRSDSDCAGECANTGDCLQAGTSAYVQLRWTVDGVAPTPLSPEPCAGIAELEVAFSESATDAGTSYRPVPCSAGLITYDKLPPWFDEVVLTAFGPEGQTVHQERESLPGRGRTVLNFAL